MDQLRTGSGNHFSDFGWICLNPEHCTLWEGHVRFAPVFVDADLDHSQ